MIQIDNFKMLLLHLGFTAQGDIFTKQFVDTDCKLQVNFAEKQLIFPEGKGLTINARQTCNFASSENAVVFECVHRLLEKGYKPEHIELEPKWKLGHGASGGRADILVRDYQGVPLLIIECKTHGKEFEKAWKNTQEDGAQLFSYIEQEKATRFICLYASLFDTDSQQIKLSQKIISVTDNPTILANHPKLGSFAAANNNKERFAVWKKTYQGEADEAGLFETSILPYQIGKAKYTLAEDTKTIVTDNIKGAYHQFRTILRKHNVSRRENAFEVLVNLFLCKIVDELEHPEELRFYWKGIAFDDYFSLVDRLQLLYQRGMALFLDQQIVYFSEQDIDDAFWAAKRNETKIVIKDIFRQLKFYKGLDFEFIKVTNEEKFNVNAKILLEVIKMWQGLRLTGSEQNQFLGDLFEYFLDNGIKQSEGQFFTPVPICKFIVSALPLEQLIARHPDPIKAIDYACGSGHFINEYAQQIPELIKTIKKIDDPTAYYKNTYGIEKEDRLAKVAKVSAFMYGRKEVNVIDADALIRRADIKEAGFQVIIANPPFAVEDFLLTLEDHRDQYTLMTHVSDLGNKNIQCFFLERAKQLLAGDGVMGVIVPSSVLSNSDSMHVATREILLKYFDFVAITELGNGTFGKTGTNTVVLFLRRKAKRPEYAEHYQSRVQDFFDDWAQELATAGGVYVDVGVVERYCVHVGLDYADYQSLLRKEISDDLLKTEIFKDYHAAFEAENEIKKLKIHKLFKQKTEDEQRLELYKLFYDYVRLIEQDKLYYFMLALNNPCPVILVKSPADNKQQKQFLGYEWSAAKGNEGVKYNGGETVYQINTPMFDPKDRNNADKISYVIRQNFLGESVSVPESLQSFVSQANLVDLLDFGRKNFDKTFSLTVKKVSEVVSRWPIVKLSSIVQIISGGTPDTNRSEYWDGDIPWLSVADFSDDERFVSSAVKKITNLGLENSSTKILQVDDLIVSARGTVGALAQIAKPMAFNQSCYGIRAKKDLVNGGYLYYIVKEEVRQFKDSATGLTFGAITISTFDSIKIPLPPFDIQQKIVDECEAVDEAVSVAQEDMRNLKNDIKEEVKRLSVNFNSEKLTNFIDIISGGTPKTNISEYWNGDIPWLSVADFSRVELYVEKTEKYISELGLKNSNTQYLNAGDLIISARGTVGALAQLTIPMTFNQSCYGLRAKKDIDIGYLFYILKQEIAQLKEKATGVTFGAIVKATFDSIKIPVPPLAEQAALVAQIEAIEAKIAEAQAVIDAAPAQKQIILKKYL